ncbi:hypothetical protein LUX33_23700 [Actinomadura madurae]|nr:hypothetical protein [Actinomadura madurae]MCP9951122.1 hypothetical protein [Actinomadura madurae]MCP9967900.1 hypothetical protein [Actinomadura madurae]MCP9980356.1 hypothetical protein [Actinomadura madurae]
MTPSAGGRSGVQEATRLGPPSAIVYTLRIRARGKTPASRATVVRSSGADEHTTDRTRGRVRLAAPSASAASRAVVGIRLTAVTPCSSASGPTASGSNGLTTTVWTPLRRQSRSVVCAAFVPTATEVSSAFSCGRSRSPRIRRVVIRSAWGQTIARAFPVVPDVNRIEAGRSGAGRVLAGHPGRAPPWTASPGARGRSAAGTVHAQPGTEGTPRPVTAPAASTSRAISASRAGGTGWRTATAVPPAPVTAAKRAAKEYQSPSEKTSSTRSPERTFSAAPQARARSCHS